MVDAGVLFHAITKQQQDSCPTIRMRIAQLGVNVSLTGTGRRAPAAHRLRRSGARTLLALRSHYGCTVVRMAGTVSGERVEENPHNQWIC